MSARPIFARILTALLLAPMDSRQLTAVLSIDQPAVCRRLLQMHERGDVRRMGVRRHNHYPAICYSLTKKGARWAQELIA